MFTARPELSGSFGMVSSTHWLASSVGMAVLEADGNAFDAAVAAGFALQVVEPHLNGPGGDLSLIFAAAGEAPVVLCGQGPAPSRATIEHYLSLGLNLIPGSGLLAAAVPGATPAWLTLLRDYGTISLRDCLAYAIWYAEKGIPVLPQIARTISSVAEMLRTEWPTSAEQYLPWGAPPAVGTWLRNVTLARTFHRLVREAEAATRDRDAQIDHALDSWSTGFVADAVDRFARSSWMDSSGQAHCGVITGDDLAGWRPSYETPSTIEFRGLTLCKTGPWGQGPVLLQQLALLEGFDLVPGTAEFIHTVVECAKLAYADREAWYGDAAPVPLADLLSKEYAANRRLLVTDVASRELRPGWPGGRAPILPAALEHAETEIVDDLTTGEPTVSDTGVTKGDTCHVDVADRWGNMVAAMPSGGWLQSSPFICDLGFPLGTRLQIAWLQPGLPNSLAPGTRPRTTLSPSLALRDGQAVLAFGTPGGDQQDQWQLGFLLNYLLADVNLQQAIEAPAFHTLHFPRSFYPRAAAPGRIVLEDRFAPEIVGELERRGHDVTLSDPWSLARMCVVARDPDSAVLKAAANPRGMQGYAVGR